MLKDPSLSYHQQEIQNYALSVSAKQQNKKTQTPQNWGNNKTETKFHLQNKKIIKLTLEIKWICCQHI